MEGRGLTICADNRTVEKLVGLYASNYINAVTSNWNTNGAVTASSLQKEILCDIAGSAFNASALKAATPSLGAIYTLPCVCINKKACILAGQAVRNVDASLATWDGTAAELTLT